MDIQRINELLNDENFSTELVNASSIEEIQKLFKNNGVELNQEEVAEIVSIISEMAKMPEEDLEEVVGGAKCPQYIYNESKNILNDTTKEIRYVECNNIADSSNLAYKSLKIPVNLIKTISAPSFYLDKEL